MQSTEATTVGGAGTALPVHGAAGTPLPARPPLPKTTTITTRTTSSMAEAPHSTAPAAAAQVVGAVDRENVWPAAIPFLSFANADVVRTEHVHLSLRVDFERKCLEGSVTLRLLGVGGEKRPPASSTDQLQAEILLDTQMLEIQQVEELLADNNSRPLPWRMRDLEQTNFSHNDGESAAEAQQKDVHRALCVQMEVPVGDVVTILVHYSTQPHSPRQWPYSALQWLSPWQTAGKRKPMVLTDGFKQACSWFPCQDTPDVKSSYTASITVPENFSVLMSASCTNTATTGDAGLVFQFEQKTPVTAAHIFLAVGEFTSVPVGPRSKVWAEKMHKFLSLAEKEFVALEKYLEAAEVTLSPYEWPTLDLFILPFSFAYTGMTFPGIITVAAARCEVVASLIERGAEDAAAFLVPYITLSWIGVLATPLRPSKSFANGLLTYVSRKIVGQVLGTDIEHLHMMIGIHLLLQQHYNNAVKTNNNTAEEQGDIDTDSESQDHELEYHFLLSLEEYVGCPRKFMSFVQDFLEQFRAKTFSEADFRQCFAKRFNPNTSERAAEQLSDQKRIFKGVLLDLVRAREQKEKSGNKPIQEVNFLIRKVIETETCSPNDIDGWPSYKIFYFFQELLAQLESGESTRSKTKISQLQLLQKIDQVYQFAKTVSPPFYVAWLAHCLRFIRETETSTTTSSQAKNIYDHYLQSTLSMLGEYGQLAILEPLYDALIDREGAAGKQQALETFQRNYGFYTGCARASIAATLDLSEEEQQEIELQHQQQAIIEVRRQVEKMEMEKQKRVEKVEKENEDNMEKQEEQIHATKAEINHVNGQQKETEGGKTSSMEQGSSWNVPSTETTTTEEGMDTEPKEGNKNETNSRKQEDEATQEGEGEGEDEREQEKEGEEEQNESEEEDEEAEEEEEEEYRAPIMDGRTLKFQTRILNQFLLCGLCMGYFRDAHAVRECLHTFCKSCLFKYFQHTADCPTCGVDLRPNPHDKIKFDHTLQTLVNKIFADVMVQDKEQEAAFYRKRGKIAQAEEVEAEIRKTREAQQGGSQQQQNDQNSRPKKRIKRDPSKPIYKDEVAFELLLDESETDSTLKQLEKPVIRTSARVTVRHLKKFLRMKLDLPSINDLDIMYKKEVLGMEHSLEYILKTRGHEQGAIVFTYRRRRNVI